MRREAAASRQNKRMTDDTPNHAAPERRLVLVVGPYRSGTSLLSGILGQLGFHVPRPEVQADGSNPRGFGEPRWVVDFHTRLMRERRVTVLDSRPDAWSEMAKAAADEEVFKELSSWLSVQFVGTENVVVKDPRIGLFLPLWLRAAGGLGIHASFVSTLRHPTEVVTSARTWYGPWQNDASRVAGWLNVTLHAEHATRSAPRAFVRYEDLLADWPREISRFAQLLDLPWLVDVERSVLSAGRTPSSIRVCAGRRSAGTRSRCRRPCKRWQRTCGARCPRSLTRAETERGRWRPWTLRAGRTSSSMRTQRPWRSRRSGQSNLAAGARPRGQGPPGAHRGPRCG